MFGHNHLEIRRIQILAEMEAYKDRLISELSDLDKESLARLRDLLSDYYAAKESVALQAEGIVKITSDALAKYELDINRLNGNFVDNMILAKNEILNNAGIFSVLPDVTSSDNGKILQVENGRWTAVSIPFAEDVSV